MYHLNWRPVFQNFDLLWQGILLGLGLALLSLTIGCVIGLLAAFARVYGRRQIRVLATAYTEFIRNIPLLLIIYFVLAVPFRSYVQPLAVMMMASAPACTCGHHASMLRRMKSRPSSCAPRCVRESSSTTRPGRHRRRQRPWPTPIAQPAAWRSP